MGLPLPRSPHALLALLWILVLSISLLSASSSASRPSHAAIDTPIGQIKDKLLNHDEGASSPPLATHSDSDASLSTHDDSEGHLLPNLSGNKRRNTVLPTEPRIEQVCHPPTLVKLNVIFDAIIALAYFSIPIEVAYFYHRHPTPQLFWVYVLFFSFIMLCGITHAIHALSPFELPTLHAFFKVLCGFVSILTAVYLVKFIPAALKLPNYTAYLEYEIQERQISELTLRNKNEESKKLRACTERLRQTLQVQAILVESTSSLCTQLELESCCFVRYNTKTRSLMLSSPYTSFIYEDNMHMPHSLRASHPDAIAAFHSIIEGEHIRLLDSGHIEALFGKQAAMNYLDRRGASLQLSKSTVCSHVRFPDNEPALLLLLRPADGSVWSVSEIELVRDIATQIEIALSQARSIERDKELLHELQKKNTELEQAQQRAEQATHAKSKFIAIMSHEMRTPLYVVTALTELLLETPLNPEQRESLSTIQTSGRLLLAIISDVLDYSKFQQDNFIMDKAPFNIRTCIEKCVDIAGVKAHEAGLDVFYHLRDGFPEIIDTDESRLSQVFLNLLSNAVKFTKAGTLQLYGYVDKYLTSEEIAQLYKTQFASTDKGTQPPKSNNFGPESITPPSTPGPQSLPFGPNQSTSFPTLTPESYLSSLSSTSASTVESLASQTPNFATPISTLRNMPPTGTKLAMLHFVVRDTGVGIPSDSIPRLFEEFMQLDTSISRKYEGSGLGLAICRRVVTILGGTIWVNSTPGIGSDFHFTIIAKIPPSSIALPLMLPNAGARGLSTFLISRAAPLQYQVADFCAQMGMSMPIAVSPDVGIRILSASPRPTVAMILVDATCLPKPLGAASIIQQLNAFAPTIVIGDTNGTDVELETPQMTLPLRFKTFYYTACRIFGVHPETSSEISQEKFIAEILNAKQRYAGTTQSDASSDPSSPFVGHHFHSQGLTRSGSAGSVSSGGSSDSSGPAPSPRREPAGASSALSQLTGHSSHILESMSARGALSASASNVPCGGTPAPHEVQLSSSPPSCASGCPYYRQNSGCVKIPSSTSAHLTSSDLDNITTVNPTKPAKPSTPTSRELSYPSGESSLSTILPFGETSEGFRILLVEDNVVCRKVCLKQLNRLGLHDVDTAVNGQEALDRTSARHYDVIMMDVMMPGVDGLTATRAIRQRGERSRLPRQMQPYIIAITASSMLEEGSREACITAGMDDVVNKPIHLKALQEALKRFFSSHPDSQPATSSSLL